MFHPLQPDLSTLSETEIDEKIKELSKTYFNATRFSPAASGQVLMLLDGYKMEKATREQKRMEQVKQSYNSDLDGLINIG